MLESAQHYIFSKSSLIFFAISLTPLSSPISPSHTNQSLKEVLHSPYSNNIFTFFEEKRHQSRQADNVAAQQYFFMFGTAKPPSSKHCSITFALILATLLPHINLL